jgi:hypothetical protein
MKRSNTWLTALLQIAILLSVVAFATPWLVAAESSLPTPRRSGDITLRGLQARPVFNGSVVLGGVYSPDELRRAVDRDAVVADHYRNVNLDEMRAVTLTAGRSAYVSYRRGDRVHWTRERVWLKAGETVLTDGTTVIRARCGNCVSEVKQDNVAAVDPAHGELDDFVVPPTPDAGVDALAPAAEAELGGLLDVPFAPAAFAALVPGDMLPLPELVEDPFGETGFPFLPPLIVPTGGTGGGAGTPGVPGVTVLPDDGVDDPPPPPPPGFVPPDAGTGTPGLGTGTGTPDGATGAPGGSTSGTPVATTSGPPGGSSTGFPTDTLTNGWPVDTTSGLSTGTPTGGVFPTTVGVTTSSGGATSAPEPGVLWLVTAGVVGLARRRLKGR